MGFCGFFHPRRDVDRAAVNPDRPLGVTLLADDNLYHCTPQSVASHTLYENADPFELKEPPGTLRTDKARYEAVSDRAVRVSGSEFVHDPEYTIKLEGYARSDIRKF